MPFLCPFGPFLALLGLLLAVLKMGEVGLSSDEYGNFIHPNQVIFKFLICPFVPFRDLCPFLCPFGPFYALLVFLLAVLRMVEVGFSSDEYGLTLGT